MLLLWEMKTLQHHERKDAIYTKEDFSDEDGVRAAELEGEFVELEVDTESEASQLLKPKHSRIAIIKHERIGRW